MRTLYGLGLGILLIASAPTACGSDDDGGGGGSGNAGGATGGAAGSSGSGATGGSGGAIDSGTGGTAGAATGGTAGAGGGGDPTAALKQALQVSFKALGFPMNPSSACTGSAPNFTACPCDGGGSFDLTLGSPNTQTANACTDAASGLSYTGTQTLQLPSGPGVSTFTVNMTQYGACTAATGSYTIDQSTKVCSGNLSAMCPKGTDMVAILCTVSGSADTFCDCT